VVCNVNIAYRNLKSDNSKDMPRNLNDRFMDSTSDVVLPYLDVKPKKGWYWYCDHYGIGEYCWVIQLLSFHTDGHSSTYHKIAGGLRVRVERGN
jgi:hypothetical protein